MRLSKADFPSRVNGDLRLRFQASGLTSFAGLELVRRYFRSIDLAGRIRRHLGNAGLDGDYGVVGFKPHRVMAICGDLGDARPGLRTWPSHGGA